MPFEGNNGTKTVVTPETKYSEDDPGFWSGITGTSGSFKPTGGTTTNVIPTHGKDNVVTPGNFNLGGSSQEANASIANYGAHGASWDGKTSPWQKDFSDQQGQYLQQLALRAQGKGPQSSAEQQLAQSTAQNQQAQQSLAMSSRGSNAIAGAGQQAAQAQGQLAQQGANQMGQLHAQQQQAAQGQLVNTLSQVRGQNDQQTQSDSARQADMIKFYSQLGFDAQQSQLMAQQQMDQLNGEVWWQKLGFKTEQDAIDKGYRDNQNNLASDREAGLQKAGINALSFGFANM